jgi:glutamyl-tRNA synthetase
MKIRTRFAPSPTGVLHLGSVRTALFCWLYARHHNGQFILRIEDTDRARSTEENVQAILDGLAWLGLDADEGPFFQTHRFERYREIVTEWLDTGKAYYCYCTKQELEDLRARQTANGSMMRYDGRCRDRGGARSGVVKGRVVFENKQLDDLIIARSDGTPTYNFTVVIDDTDMEITHVIRGDDHLNNTPRQINMFRAMGVTPPVFAHLPMILGPDGTKLSKRHGAVDVREYREHGYLPEALLNYLVRLGWSHGDQEIFSIEEMISLFDIAQVNQSASSFNAEKLLWTNQQHIMLTPPEVLGKKLAPYLDAIGLDRSAGPDPADVAAGFRERADTLLQMAQKARYCYEDFEDIDAAAAKKHLRPVVLEPLRSVRARLAALMNWERRDIAETIELTARLFNINLGKLGQPIRVAITGNSISPPIDVTVYLVGRQRILERLDHAIEFIELRSA